MAGQTLSRVARTAGLLGGMALLIVAFSASQRSLYAVGFATGWALLVLLAGASAGRWWAIRSAAPPTRWVAPSLGLGLLTLVSFALHVELRVPNGWLDCALAGLFLLLLASGALGALLQLALRSGALECSGDADPTPLEDARRELQRRAFALYEGGAVGGSAGEFLRHFEAPRSPWQQVLGSGQPLRRLLRDLDAVRSAAPPPERRTLEELAELVIAKDRLDVQHAGCVWVRCWLLFHISLGASLLTLGAMHGVLVHTHGLFAHVMLGR